MGKTKIEYLDYTWNFVTGCNNWKDPLICGGGGSQFDCWAKAMAERFGQSFETQLNLKPFKSLTKQPCRVGVCFTGDLFQDSIHDDFGLSLNIQSFVFNEIGRYPQHQFFFLTKCPWNLQKWGWFPDNAWVGVSVTNERQYNQAIHYLADVEAENKWLSFEPLMEPIKPTSDIGVASDMDVVGIKWIVIGGLSNKPVNQQPAYMWVERICTAADDSHIPVFIKDNILNMDNTWVLRRNYPELLGCDIDGKGER